MKNNSKIAIIILLSILIVFGTVLFNVTLFAHNFEVPVKTVYKKEIVEETISTTKSEETTSTTSETITIAATSETTIETTSFEYVDVKSFNNRKSYDNWLFVGDSRFEFWRIWGFYGEYIAESGQGLNMIYDNYDEITSYRDYNIVFNLGANQWWSGEEYVDLLNSFPEEFIQNNHIIIMPVNPTDGSFDYLNEKFDNYNDILKNNLRSEYEYFDTASYMKDHGFDTADGLHYTMYEDSIIYDLLMYGE